MKNLLSSSSLLRRWSGITTKRGVTLFFISCTNPRPT